MKEALTRQELVDLYKRAEKEHKILLLKVFHQGQFGLKEWIAYGTGLIHMPKGHHECKASSIAGSFHQKFCFDIASGKGWNITQANKKDLLLYLDQPQDSKTLKKILDGTLQVLE